MNQAWLRILPLFIQTRLNGRHKLQKILSNVGWLFFDKILRMGVGLIVGIWVARYLGPEQYGALNFAVAFVALFGAFATLGLEQIAVRDIIKEPQSKDEILGSAFVLKLIGGIFTLVITIAIISLIRIDDVLTRWLVGIIAAGFVFQAFDTIDFLFQSQLQSKYTVYSRNCAFIAISLVKVALILIHAPLLAFAWAGLAEIVLGSLFLIIAYYINHHSIREWRARFQTMKRLLADSWSLIIAGIAIMIYVKIDQVMLGNMIGNKDVGTYAAAVKISEVWYFMATSISSTVFPVMIEYKKKDEALFLFQFQRLCSILASISIVIAIVITLFSHILVKLLYGIRYLDAAPILSVHIWSVVFVFIAIPISMLVMINGLQKLILVSTVIGAIINILLNLLLIPLYSGFGAAIATVVSYGVAGYFSYFIFPETRNAALITAKSVVFPWRYLVAKV
jgi:PST family polysaccharide transporter